MSVPRLRLRETTETAAPPWDETAERHVLSACLYGGVERARTILEPEHFFRETHEIVYAACLAVADADATPDVALVGSHLQRLGLLDRIGGVAALAELAAIGATVTNVEQYAEIVVERHRDRAVLALSQTLADVSANGGVIAHPELNATIEALRETIDGVTSSKEIEPMALDELLAKPPPSTDWLWNGWIARGSLAIVVGDPKVGKSLLMLGAAAASRDGTPYLDEPIAKANWTIVDLENPENEVHKRLSSFGYTTANVSHLQYVHMPALDLSHPAALAKLGTLVEKHDTDVLVLDSLRRLAPSLDENDSGAISQIMTALRVFSVRRSLTIIVIHHAKKKVQGEAHDAKALVRGSSDILASVDTLLFVRKKSGEANTFILEHGANRLDIEHETIQVEIQADDGRLALNNAGGILRADDNVDQLLDKIVQTLGERGSLTNTDLASALGTDARTDTTYRRSLKLGVQRKLLEKRKTGRFVTYALLGDGRLDVGEPTAEPREYEDEKTDGYEDEDFPF